ncbi:MAG: hypothetical protein JWM76_2403 [Pseudonocardiales bacterium]|nr:hypothetical protein [Pseudonocardiales bacterium]
MRRRLVATGGADTTSAKDPAIDATGTPATEAEAPTMDGPAVDLRILVLTASEDEPSMLAWGVLLEREGVPFDMLVAGIGNLTIGRLEHRPGRGRYQAIVLATDSLVCLREGSYVSGLTDAEWETLQAYERAYSVRQVSAYATPAPSIGLQPPSWAGDMGETIGVLTQAGRAVFPELVGPVPLSPGTYGFTTAITENANFTTLAESETGSPIVGVVIHPDAREELVFTVATGPYSRHFHLLGHGALQWVTRGKYLGRHSYYLSLQIDDVLLGAPGDIDDPPIRMTPEDVRACVAWSERNRVRLDLAYNGWGSVTALMASSTDPLTDELVENAESFNWLNHTFGHLNLDDVSAEEARDEIKRNVDWAAANRVPVQVGALVTGAHSGLDNPNVAAVLEECGIDWLAADASIEPESRSIAGAQTVPRHPINIPLDVATYENLHRRRHGDRSGLSVDTKRADAFSIEVGLMLDHILSNDPRPHYTHQNALVRERLLLGLLDDVLKTFRELISVPLRQMSLAEAGLELKRRRKWARLVDDGAVSAAAIGDSVRVENRTIDEVEVPITGDGRTPDQGWVFLGPGQSIVVGATTFEQNTQK